MMAFNVMKSKGDTVLLDGNHALAGKALRFAIKVLDVRLASEEEIAHQHGHGEHGHHHCRVDVGLRGACSAINKIASCARIHWPRGRFGT